MMAVWLARKVIRQKKKKAYCQRYNAYIVTKNVGPLKGAALVLLVKAHRRCSVLVEQGT